MIKTAVYFALLFLHCKAEQEADLSSELGKPPRSPPILLCSDKSDHFVQTLPKAPEFCLPSPSTISSVPSTIIEITIYYQEPLVGNRQDMIGMECRIKVGKTLSCIKTGNIISCGDKYTYFQGWEVDEICGIKALRSNLNKFTLFSSSEAGELHEDVLSTQNILSKIQKKMSYIPGTFSQDYVPSDARNITLIKDVLDGGDGVIDNFHFETCFSNRIKIAELFSDLTKGVVDFEMIRRIYGESFRAQTAGDVLLLWKCFQVEDYVTLPSLPECRREFPVRYVHKGEVLEGWVGRKSREISDAPQQKECVAALAGNSTQSVQVVQKTEL